VSAAIANAVFHATGVRVRDLPITIERLLKPAGRTDPGLARACPGSLRVKGRNRPADMAHRPIGQGVVETADILARDPRDGD